MKIVYFVLFFILGTLFGSFYTVVGYRLPLHQDFVKKRSHCDSCLHPLSFFDLFPILSFLFLRGRCRYCGEKISPVSTYMELFTGILFCFSFYLFGFSYELLIALGIVSLFIILSVSDIAYYIIPDEVLIFFTGYFIIISVLQFGVVNSLFHILSGLCLFFIMYGIMLLGNFFFRKETLGGGDIKLMFVVGLVLNPFLGLILIFLASLLALPVSLVILWKKGVHMIPFGPFLLVSFMFLYFTGINLSMIIEWIRLI